MKHTHQRGFSLIELLLVIGIIAIISGIAIPAYMGQRQRARMIGDAKANASVLAMQLETRRADSGLYAPPDTKVEWRGGKVIEGDANFLPNFTPQGNSKMNFRIEVGPTGLTYNVIVYDPQNKDVQGARILEKDQTGATVFEAGAK